MMTKIKFKISRPARTKRPAAALLVVLFVIMAITILALGFLSRSDVELACGQNMALRQLMDYLAESGLQHARGLILCPQDLASEYWTGAEAQQLVAGTDDYYDVKVLRNESDPTNRCNYTIDCNAYRLKNGRKIARSTIQAELRLDPCIAYWAGSNTTIAPGTTIHGDVYSAGNLANNGTIIGDVFATGTITGTPVAGQKNQSTAQPPVDWPPPQVSDFSSCYYIGWASYSVDVIGSYVHPSGSFYPSAANPAGVRYCNGNLDLPGNVNIEGMLVVNGTLNITSTNNVITAVKNFPAVLVAGDLVVEPNADVQVTGLAIINGQIKTSAQNTSIDILGGLFAQQGIAETTHDASGNKNTALLYSSPLWQPLGGKNNGALQLDGVDDYLQTPNSASRLQLTDDYTLSVWIKPAATQKIWAGICSKCDPTGSTNHWTLQFDDTTSRNIVIYHPAESWFTGIKLTDVAGNWHHIAIVRTGNNMTAYLDGITRNSSPWNCNPGTGDGHLNIAADRTALSDYLYKGLIDDLRVYNRPLEPNDIYPPKDGLPGLIAHWKLDDGGSHVTITAAPSKTALLLWPQPGTPQKWQQAAGAFFRSIQRK